MLTSRMINYAGQVFGTVTVVSWVKGQRWNCVCSCGVRFERSVQSLKMSKNPKCPECERVAKGLSREVADTHRKNTVIGKTFMFLKAIESLDDKGRSYRCVCTVCGADDIKRTANSLKTAASRKNDNSCCTFRKSREEGFTVEDIQLRIAMKQPEKKLPPRLDVDRNRERYVRLKVVARGSSKEMQPFPAYTCAECPNAPECEKAFDAANLRGECAKGVAA